MNAAVLATVLNEINDPRPPDTSIPVNIPQDLRDAIDLYFHTKETQNGVFTTAEQKDIICQAIMQGARKIGLSTSIIPGWILLYGDDTVYSFTTTNPQGYVDVRGTKLARGMA